MTTTPSIPRRCFPGFLVALTAALFLFPYFQHAAHWPAVRDLGWTFQIQAVAIAVGGAFSPLPWHAPMMIMVGSVSALFHVLKEEQAAKMKRLAGY